MITRDTKEYFLSLYKEKITRPGADKLLEWLEKESDFFKAPASTRYHLAEEGGLALHSIHVYERLKLLVEAEEKKTGICHADDESIAIVALLHDVCKANFYTVEMRNRKNEFGAWESYPYYSVDDQLPYGHGEKSVYIVSGFMKLKRAEAMAIRWHMGFSDNDFKGGGYSVGNAYEKFPLAVLTNMADMSATYLDEIESQEK